MKEPEHIQELISRFMEAQTTEDEERTLSDYFCSCDDIPSELSDYAILFRGMKSAGSHVRVKADSWRRWASGIAASVLVIILGSALYLATHMEKLPARQEADHFDCAQSKIKEASSDSREQTPTTQLLSRVHPETPEGKDSSRPSVTESLEPETPESMNSQSITNTTVTSANPEMPIETAPADNEYIETELIPAILIETEFRVAMAQLREEYLHRAIIEEVYTNIINEPQKPELTL